MVPVPEKPLCAGARARWRIAAGSTRAYDSRCRAAYGVLRLQSMTLLSNSDPFASRNVHSAHTTALNPTWRGAAVDASAQRASNLQAQQRTRGVSNAA